MKIYIDRISRVISINIFGVPEYYDVDIRYKEILSIYNDREISGLYRIEISKFDLVFKYYRFPYRKEYEYFYPNSHIIYDYLGFILSEFELYNGSIECYKKSIEIFRYGSFPYFQIIRIYEKMGNHYLARKWIDKDKDIRKEFIKKMCDKINYKIQ